MKVGPVGAGYEAYIREIESTMRTILDNFESSGMPPIDALAVLMETTMAIINMADDADVLLEKYIEFLRMARRETLEADDDDGPINHGPAPDDDEDEVP